MKVEVNLILKHVTVDIKKKSTWPSNSSISFLDLQFE
jgi:hypothetical protein